MSLISRVLRSVASPHRAQVVVLSHAARTLSTRPPFPPPPQAAAGGRPGRPTPPPGPAPPPRPMGILDASGNVMRSKPLPPPTRPTPAKAGAGGAVPTAAGAPSEPIEVVFEADESNFQAVVLQSPVAVVLDCYAEWCEPCKALTPKLEALARSARGAFRLVKLNVDTSPGIAGQLGVKSLPSVLGIVGGKLVDSFQGVPEEAALQAFFGKVLGAAEQAGLIPAAAGNPMTKLVEAIATSSVAVDENDFEEALAVIPQVIETLQKLHAQIYSGLTAESEAKAKAEGKGKEAAPVRTDIGPLADINMMTARAVAVLVRALLGSAQAAIGQVSATSSEGENSTAPADASTLFSQARSYADVLRTRFKAFTKDADVARALSAADLAKDAEKAVETIFPLVKALAAAPADADIRFALAEAQVGGGQYAAAIDNLLTLIKQHGVAWREGAAKMTLLKVFDSLGASHPDVVTGRKQLSKLLFR